MKRKYMEPSVEVIVLKAQGTLLAGSSLPVSSEPVTDGWADSRELDALLSTPGNDDLINVLLQ